MNTKRANAALKACHMLAQYIGNDDIYTNENGVIDGSIDPVFFKLLRTACGLKSAQWPLPVPTTAGFPLHPDLQPVTWNTWESPVPGTISLQLNDNNTKVWIRTPNGNWTLITHSPESHL